MSQRKILKVVVFGLAVVLIASSPVHAYIGPGAGIAVGGSLLVMFTAFLAGILALLTWPLRYAYRMYKGRRAFARARVKRFVILGLDGIDPELTQKYMSQGKLPNLSKLAKQGCFGELQTTVPSISPVAWSSFQTGVNPGKHNIFDFLTRDKKTYAPKLSSVDIRGPKKVLNIGKYQFPLGKGDIRLLRKGKPFWVDLGEHGIFSNILRVPITFPPEKFSGVQLSAMCVPDLRGTQGMFSFYTTQELGEVEHTGGENIYVKRNSDTIKSNLVGCGNPFLKDGGEMKCPFEVSIKEPGKADLKLNGDIYSMEVGEYTEWIKAEFKAGFGVKVSGVCKFLLISTEPEFEMYVTPINIDPEKPAMPISHPAVYSCYFSKLFGPYATLGLAEDSWALNEKILDDKGFMEQSIAIDKEREEMFFDALDKTRHGLCVCVFDGTDRVQHSFWRYIDEGHPAHEGQIAKSKQCRDAIEGVYRRMDDVVGKTMEKCADDDTVLMVISDHGFNSFRYGIDLNRWLEDNGYLVVKEGERGKQYLSGIDWSKTRAFAIGLTGMYLNIKGRESQGIVDPGAEADGLREEIAGKLKGLYDQERDTSAIKEIYNAMKIYRGPYKKEAPDLMVGYQKGYRASWDTAIGKVSEEVFHVNTKAWSGDHCIDPSLVPGVIFCNRKIGTENPRIMDLGPTVLEMFGVDVPKYMDGKPLVVADAGQEIKDKKDGGKV